MKGWLVGWLEVKMEMDLAAPPRHGFKERIGMGMVCGGKVGRKEARQGRQEGRKEGRCGIRTKATQVRI